MIADICNKIAKNGSNLSERLEDNLTGNFFGALRYLPFNLALKQILIRAVFPSQNTKLIQSIDYDFWEPYISFWPYDEEGEIDVVLDFPNCIIGIEVKYRSGLSSDDNSSNGNAAETVWENSRNQLARESRILSRRGYGKEKLLIFLAPEPDCLNIYHKSMERIHPDVNFVCASWQDVLSALDTVKSDNQYEQLILNDVKALLIQKGFEKFRSFNTDIDIFINPNEFYNFESVPFSFGNVKNHKVKEDEYYVFGN